MRAFVSVMISIITILIYRGLEGTKEGVQNRTGALFFICLNGGFSSMSNVSLVFPAERPVFIREVTNGMYRSSTYYWGKLWSEQPMGIMITLI